MISLDAIKQLAMSQPFRNSFYWPRRKIMKRQGPEKCAKLEAIESTLVDQLLAIEILQYKGKEASGKKSLHKRLLKRPLDLLLTASDDSK